MTFRSSNKTVIAAWQDAGIRRVRAEPHPASEAVGPSDTETMVGRSFPLGRLRMASAKTGRPDSTPEARIRLAVGARSQITPFPGCEAARVGPANPAGQSRDAVSVGAGAGAIPARRVWSIPDIS